MVLMVGLEKMQCQTTLCHKFVEMDKQEFGVRYCVRFRVENCSYFGFLGKWWFGDCVLKVQYWSIFNLPKGKVAIIRNLMALGIN